MIYCAQKTRLQQTRIRQKQDNRKGHRMTMAYENEVHTTRPTSSEATSLLEQNESNAINTTAVLVNAMFEEYISIQQNEKQTYMYDSGSTTPIEVEIDTTGVAKVSGNEAIYTTFDKAEILEAKKEDLKLYVKGSLISGALEFDASILQSKGTVSIDDIVDIYVSDYLSKLTAAEGTPNHITVVEKIKDTETERRFMKIIKGFGSYALSAVQSATSIISGPIDISKLKSRS
jgi:hypothetical protein